MAAGNADRGGRGGRRGLVGSGRFVGPGMVLVDGGWEIDEGRRINEYGKKICDFELHCTIFECALWIWQTSKLVRSVPG